jgi:CHAD domain-containing protein
LALDVPSRSYVLADTQRADDVLRDLAGRLREERAGLDLQVAEPVETTRTLLDTADRRLRDAGLDLAAEVTGTGVALTLDDAGGGGRPLRAELPKVLRRYLVDDLPPGPLRDRLDPVMEVRALLPLVDVHRRDVAVAVLNSDAKTVVRIVVSDLWASPAPEAGERPRFGLAGRVEVTGVLGYRRPFARVDTLLGDEVGLAAPTTSLVDEAVRAVGGDLAGLSTQVSVAMDGDEPAGLAARRILIPLADVVEANLPGTIDDLDPEFVHDMRVAIRRSRSVLRELKHVFDDEQRREHAATLKWIQSITGPLRDLDVQLMEWDGLVSQVPDDRRAALDPARGVLRAKRAAALRNLRRTLRSAQYHRRWDAYRTFLEADRKRTAGPDDDRPLHRLASRRVRKVYKRMVGHGSTITEDSPAQDLHDLRKKGKELRYLLESFGQLWPPKRTKTLVADLKALQDVLGKHQDREVQADNLRSLAADLVSQKGGSEAVLALGSLVDRLERDQRKSRAEFAGRFEVFAEEKLSGIT